MTKEYPMTYDEYEKRIIELYLDGISEDHKEKIKQRIDNLLKNDPTFLSGQSCFYYDNPEKYGDVAKKEFEDENLKGTPVRTLDMFVGGDWIKYYGRKEKNIQWLMIRLNKEYLKKIEKY